MKKILFITFIPLEANSSVTKSNYAILKGLMDLECDITIVMPEISRDISYYDDSYNVNNIADKIVRMANNGIGGTLSKQVNTSNGIKKKVIHLLRTVYYDTHVFDRTKEYVSQAKMIINQLERFYDVVLTTSDPKASHLMVSKLKKYGLNYGRWIQHWGDPIVGDITRKTLLPTAFLKSTERRVLKKADKIVYVSPFTMEEQKERYPSLAIKMFFVPLPADITIPASENRQKRESIFEVVYLGDYHSNVRNILPLYSAINEMKDVHLTIAGYSDIELEETNNISILPRISQEKCNEYERNADCIISIGNLSGTQIPGKIYYSSSNGKPILCLIEGSESSKMKSYIDSYGRFDTVMNNKEDIINKLFEIMNRNNHMYCTPEILLPTTVVKKIVA